MFFPERRVTSFWSRVDCGQPDECWPWTGCRTKYGYGRIKIGKRAWVTHRLALLLVTERWPDDQTFALHSCDNPPCCNPHHLRWGTSADNKQDEIDRNRIHRWRGSRRGTANPCSKLTEEQVVEIYRTRGKYKFFREQYGIGKTTCRYIRKGLRWQHVTGDSSNERNFSDGRA